MDPTDEAALVAADPERRLVSLTHRSTRQLHYTVTDEVATDWATVHLFVTFLLTGEPSSGLGQGFFDYLFNPFLLEGAVTTLWLTIASLASIVPT